MAIKKTAAREAETPETTESASAGAESAKAKKAASKTGTRAKGTGAKKPAAGARGESAKRKVAAAPKTKKSSAADEGGPELFAARARYVRYSPYKLRPIADVVRGKDVPYALNWLLTYRTQRAEPVRKLLQSAIANAKSVKNKDAAALMIKEIKIDGGPIHRYFKPGAQGRAQIQRKRMCHISITLQSKA